MACVHCGRDLATPTASHCQHCGEPAVVPAVPASFLATLREYRARPLTVGFFVRKNLKGYAAMLVIFSALGAAAVLLDMQSLAAGVAGAWFGSILRDLGLFRQIVKIWPYEAAVLDWALIDRLAAGEPAEKTAR